PISGDSGWQRHYCCWRSTGTFVSFVSAYIILDDFLVPVSFPRFRDRYENPDFSFLPECPIDP
ncbi:MAG: hypothetical protein ABJM37_08440, partial [Gilvibacter sp.]